MRKMEGQRTFVILRQLAGGRESGYARAEQRDGRVELTLVAQGFRPGERPVAAAVMQEGLLLLGEMRMDGRGQGGVTAALNASDMRSMEMLTVAVRRGAAIEIPLAGTVGRGGRVDWESVQRGLRDLLLPVEPETVQKPEPAEAAPEPMPAPQEEPVSPQVEEMEVLPEPEVDVSPETDENAAVEEPEPQPEPVSVPEPCEEIPEPPAPEEPEPTAATIQEEPSQSESADIYDLPAAEDPIAAAESLLRTPLEPGQRYELPALLRNAYWPQLLFSMHDLFERFPQVEPFPEQTDTAYVRVPLGDAYAEIDHYLVGARVEEGWVTGIGYLIPEGADGAELTGYEQKDGYWQAWQYIEPKTI